MTTDQSGFVSLVRFQQQCVGFTTSYIPRPAMYARVVVTRRHTLQMPKFACAAVLTSACRECVERRELSDWMTTNEATFLGRSRNRTIENLHDNLGRGSDSQNRRTSSLAAGVDSIRTTNAHCNAHPSCDGLDTLPCLNVPRACIPQEF